MAIIRMKRFGLVMMGAALGVYLSSASAFAVTVQPPWPTMTVQIGSETISLNPTFNFDQTLDRFTLAAPVTATASNGSSLTISNAYAIPDPVLFFSASATNLTANPLSYSFAFNAPLVPNLFGPINSHAELGVSLTDGVNNGATVQPSLPGGAMLTSFDLYANGTPISKNVDIGNLFSILSGTGTTSSSADNQLVCNQACVTMSALLAFTLTDNDSVAFSGKVVQVAPVPLPAAAWFFGSGLLGLAGVLRRKLNLA